MSMAKRISRLRKSKGYTQEYIAANLGVSRQAVFKWEKGQTSPDTENLIALAELLGTTVDYLIKGKAPAADQTAEKYFKASLIPLVLIPVCWLIGLLSGSYTEMVEIPIGRIRMGIPFLMYGHSPFAVVLAALSVTSLLLFILLLFMGNQANKDC